MHFYTSVLRYWRQNVGGARLGRSMVKFEAKTEDHLEW